MAGSANIPGLRQAPCNKAREQTTSIAEMFKQPLVINIESERARSSVKIRSVNKQRNPLVFFSVIFIDDYPS